MNFSDMQAELRHFAAERDWQPFHTPKNLSTALMVEAAELAEIFQWMTPEQSVAAALNPEDKQRISDEVADLLLYLLQLADHCEVDIARAARDKLARVALKYPALRAIARVSPSLAAVPGAHVLLDYENVQPTEDELRALAPEATRVWVFHGPHQRQVEHHFASYGDHVTAVPISKTGKNALDFHLSFYMGYIASRNPTASLIVVANDKGYEPMLEHAKAMGFSVRQLGHGRATTAEAPATIAKKSAVKKRATKPSAAAKKTPAKKAAAKKAAAQKATPAAKKRAAIQTAAPAKKATPAKKSAVKTVAKTTTAAPKPQPEKAAQAQAAKVVSAARKTAQPNAEAAIKHLADKLRKMGQSRPTKPNPLRRALKSFLGSGATAEATELALNRLISDGVVSLDAAKGVSYPAFGT